jgi:hypothetical protein
MALKISSIYDNYTQSPSSSMEQSPTATPHHTRAGSPVRGKLLGHTDKEATQTVAVLNALMNSTGGASKEMKMMRVSFVDGSASVSVATKLKFLTAYFIFNLGLTLYNKAIMIKVWFIFLSQVS